MRYAALHQRPWICHETEFAFKCHAMTQIQ
jgi:hypothetical protein